MEAAVEEDHRTDWREWTALVLLSVTAILTAWCGFQASKWGGAMSISFAQASTARIEASRHEAVANRKMSVHVGLFTQWLQAYRAGDIALADFLSERFPDPLAPAFTAWVATQPLENPDAPSTPFDMPEYVVLESALAEEADKLADSRYQEALANNQRGDNYTVLTVLYATVLFFAAISGRMRSSRAQWVMLGIALVGFAVATAFLASFPKLV